MAANICSYWNRESDARVGSAGEETVDSAAVALVVAVAAMMEWGVPDLPADDAAARARGVLFIHTMLATSTTGNNNELLKQVQRIIRSMSEWDAEKVQSRVYAALDGVAAAAGTKAAAGRLLRRWDGNSMSAALSVRAAAAALNVPLPPATRYADDRPWSHALRRRLQGYLAYAMARVAQRAVLGHAVAQAAAGVTPAQREAGMQAALLPHLYNTPLAYLVRSAGGAGLARDANALALPTAVHAPGAPACLTISDDVRTAAEHAVLAALWDADDPAATLHNAITDTPLSSRTTATVTSMSVILLAGLSGATIVSPAAGVAFYWTILAFNAVLILLAFARVGRLVAARVEAKHPQYWWAVRWLACRCDDARAASVMDASRTAAGATVVSPVSGDSALFHEEEGLAAEPGKALVLQDGTPVGGGAGVGARAPTGLAKPDGTPNTGYVRNLMRLLRALDPSAATTILHLVLILSLLGVLASNALDIAYHVPVSGDGGETADLVADWSHLAYGVVLLLMVLFMRAAEPTVPYHGIFWGLTLAVNLSMAIQDVVVNPAGAHLTPSATATGLQPVFTTWAATYRVLGAAIAVFKLVTYEGTAATRARPAPKARADLALAHMQAVAVIFLPLLLVAGAVIFILAVLAFIGLGISTSLFGSVDPPAVLMGTACMSGPIAFIGFSAAWLVVARRGVTTTPLRASTIVLAAMVVLAGGTAVVTNFTLVRQADGYPALQFLYFMVGLDAMSQAAQHGGDLLANGDLYRRFFAAGYLLKSAAARSTLQFAVLCLFGLQICINMVWLGLDVVPLSPLAAAPSGLAFRSIPPIMHLTRLSSMLFRTICILLAANAGYRFATAVGAEMGDRRMRGSSTTAATYSSADVADYLPVDDPLVPPPHYTSALLARSASVVATAGGGGGGGGGGRRAARSGRGSGASGSAAVPLLADEASYGDSLSMTHSMRSVVGVPPGAF